MDILSKIVEDKKILIEESKKLRPEIEVRLEAEKPRQQRGFVEALSAPGPSGVNIIAEVKRASPSRGDICPDLDAGKCAALYEKGGAAAISVLTDTPYFKGSIEDLKAVNQTASLPVLRKEFIISEYQIYESAVIGADAILLIVRILSPDRLKSYMDLCNKLNLGALVEVHTDDDFKVATRAGAKLIGINNRNLKSFDTDISNAVNISKMFEPDQIPVAASGISTRQDIEQNLKAGIFNFLIGESLVRAGDTVKHLQSLLGQEK
ncbi:MAG: indole-3-glycerol phosphate synthase TrpC [Desulfobacterales bacterium]|nr:indole-3-glycerol phosphate synthase TrpC [Desulfobacterales bacterium]